MKKIIPLFAAMMITGGVVNATEETKPQEPQQEETTVVDKVVDTADSFWETVKGWFN
jgi:hypothetical protein